MANLRDEILFIGIGQAGGNICQLFENKKYNTLCINSSPQDLDTLNVKHKYLITNGDGCSKDRDFAKRLIKADFANIDALITQYSTDIKIIFVVYSAGGGTGSGAGPALAKILTRKYPNSIICMITILPDLNESFTANANAYECFQDILKVENSGACFVLDNKEFGNKHEINQQFVNDFDDFINIPEKDKSIYGNVDLSEIKTTLSAHNMAIVVSIPTIDKQNKQNNMTMLFNNLEDSIFAKTEKDNVIQYMTLSLADETIKEADIKKELQKVFGMPRDNFFTYNTRESSICMLSGLSYPIKRLEEIADYIEKYKEPIQKSSNIELSADMSFLKKTRKLSEKQNDNNSDNNIDDIWDEFL